MLNESEDRIIIKLFKKIFLVFITFLAMIISLYSFPETLGAFRGSEIIGYNFIERKWVSILYFQFGMITKGFGEDIIYFYGSEDLRDRTRISVSITANNDVTIFDDNIYIYLYEANDIANPKYIQYKILKRGEVFNIQNINFNLEKGKLYIIFFRDEKGAVLMVKKIMLIE